MPILKKTKCRMKWCYSPLRHEDDTCDKICTYNTIRVQTNADRIRQMTDEELAKWIAHPKQPLYCCFEFGNCGDDCSKCALKWLKEEVDK